MVEKKLHPVDEKSVIARFTPLALANARIVEFLARGRRNNAGDKFMFWTNKKNLAEAQSFLNEPGFREERESTLRGWKSKELVSGAAMDIEATGKAGERRYERSGVGIWIKFDRSQLTDEEWESI